MINQIEKGICQKYQVSIEVFDLNTENSSNAEVKQLSQSMRTSIQNAASGIQPDSNVELPPMMTSEKTLELLDLLMMETALAIYRECLAFEMEGERVSV